jgi:hypothetical protein
MKPTQAENRFPLYFVHFIFFPLATKPAVIELNLRKNNSTERTRQ